MGLIPYPAGTESNSAFATSVVSGQSAHSCSLTRQHKIKKFKSFFFLLMWVLGLILFIYNPHISLVTIAVHEIFISTRLDENNHLYMYIEKKEPLKKAKNNKIANVAGSV